jgi:Flp pilus assembly pilin Flp
MKSMTGRLRQIAVWVLGRNGPGNEGSSLVEYVLLAALIAVVCLLALNAVGQSASGQYSNFASSLVVNRP